MRGCNASFDARPKRIGFQADTERADDADRNASAFLATLTGRKRCAMLFRIQNARKPDTRARKIEAFIGMLNRGATIHP
ncbi:YdeI/OmpD-associated family protein [Burkholderia dolosa]|uniref:YdeI/OmpD-associated family protein n=1 Tax=Burkholderia dolosa TaxID=152500 RepID=A0A892IDL2_9BURK|nr:hypothetical protein XM57_02970 [Burkholderia cepacia]AYZ95570.1 hypothetical protein EGY28_10165 [Burkholderia dolosa]ETP61820.1 hypothetical protein BDSB_29175 [Burkholderia dolosa PC543]PRE51025.1 hypothetical protein C6P87_11080 [Burkholderia sp. AU12872]PUA75453.1 hypothetical protein DB771_18310 [Burkholderia sp. AU29985]